MDAILVQCFEGGHEDSKNGSSVVFPTVVDEEGNSALHVVCAGANPAALERLLKTVGANDWLNSQNHHGLTPLMLASAVGSLPCVEAILQFAKSVSKEFLRDTVNACTTNGCTALHMAVDDGHLAVMAALVERGEAFLTTRAAITQSRPSTYQVAGRSSSSVELAVHLPFLESFGCTPIELAILRRMSPSDVEVLWAAARAVPSTTSNSGYARSLKNVTQRTVAMTDKEKRAMAQALAVDDNPIRDSSVIRSFLEDMGKMFTETDVEDIAQLLEADLFSRSEPTRLDAILRSHELSASEPSTVNVPCAINEVPLSSAFPAHRTEREQAASQYDSLQFETVCAQNGFSAALAYRCPARPKVLEVCVPLIARHFRRRSLCLVDGIASLSCERCPFRSSNPAYPQSVLSGCKQFVLFLLQAARLRCACTTLQHVRECDGIIIIFLYFVCFSADVQHTFQHCPKPAGVQRREGYSQR